MKSAVETLAPTRVKVTIEVPYDELKPSIDAAIKAIGAQITVPGFRQGKVPARIIEQRVGRGAVLQEAINEALPGLFGQAVEENDLRPISQPEVEVTQVPMEEGQDLAFTAEVDVRPELALPDLDAIAVTVDDLVVTDEEIQEQVDTLRARFGTLVNVEREAAVGDFVTLDLSATIGEDEIDSVTGVSYEVGSGNMLPGMDEALVGMSAGETTTFTAPLAGGDRQGEDADCTVTVQAVKERELPALDDDFAAIASEFDTLEELRADVARGVEQGKRFEQGVQARDKILDHLLETIEVPLPEHLVEAEVNHHLEGEDRLEDDEHRAEVDEGTRRSLKTQFILDTLVEQQEVGVSQEEFVEYLLMQAQQYRIDPNELAKAMDTNGQVPAMVAEVARRKALAGMLDRATITDASGNPVDLNQLAPAEEGDDGEAVTEGDDSEAVTEGDDSEAVTEGGAAPTDGVNDTAAAGETAVDDTDTVANESRAELAEPSADNETGEPPAEAEGEPSSTAEDSAGR